MEKASSLSNGGFTHTDLCLKIHFVTINAAEKFLHIFQSFLNVGEKVLLFLPQIALFYLTAGMVNPELQSDPVVVKPRNSPGRECK